MNDLINSLNWQEILATVWTVILLPTLTYIGREIQKYTKEKKIDKYISILQRNAIDACKDVYETIVKEIKGTAEWTEDKKAEVKEIAKKKAIYALSNSAYECLKTANIDFEEYLDGLIESALYDLKRSAV